MPEYLVEVGADLAAEHEGLAVDYAVWAGSIEDRQAAAVVQAYVDNGGQAECAAAHGEHWDWQRGIAEIEVPYYWGFEPVLAPPVRGFSGPASINQEALRRGEMRDLDNPEDLEPVLHACSAEGAPAPSMLPRSAREDGEEFLHPAVLDALQSDWDQTLSQIGREHLRLTDLSACLSRQEPTGALAGTPAGPDMASGWADVLADAESEVQRSAGRSESIERLQQVEEPIVQALWACTRDVHAPATEDLVSRMDAFNHDHAAEISQAREHWREMRALAGRLGWSADDPFAGYLPAASTS